MNIEQLSVFNRIATLRTMRAAAESLHKSQPALSASIKKLEEELGFELFNRSSYRPELTDKGLLFLERSKALLESFQELQTYARELSGSKETRLRIAIDSAAPFEALLPRIQNCTQAYPALELEFSFGVLTQCMDALVDGAADIAIAPLIHPHPDLQSHKLLQRRLVSSIHKKHCDLGDRPSPQKLKKLPNIIVGSGNKNSLYGVPGLKGGKKIHVSNHAVKEQLILAGVGWGRIPEERLWEVPYSDRVVAIHNPQLQAVDVQIDLCWSKSRNLGPVGRKVRDDLIEFCGGLGLGQNQL